MTLTFLVGLAGSLILVCGAAWPERPAAHPLRSFKNWLLAVGGLMMLAYAWLGYRESGQIFFLIFELFVNFSTILMMANTPDRFDAPLLLFGAACFVAWSLFLFEGYGTIIFVVGLAGIGLGYAMEGGTVRRETALMTGAGFVALFSYMTQNWIFFWLNVFFALFSAYYVWKLWKTTTVATLLPQKSS